MISELAKRLKETRGLSSEVVVPFIHSGLYDEWARKHKKKSGDLSDKEQQKAVEKLSKFSVTVRRLPKVELTKVFNDAVILSQGMTSDIADKQLAARVKRAAFFSKYYELLFPRLVQNIIAWSEEDEEVNDKTRAEFAEAVTPDEGRMLCIEYEAALIRDKEQAEKNGGKPSAKDSPRA